MNDSAKIRLLRLIAKYEPVANAHSLQQEFGSNTHHVVHVAYSLQKAGLIKFRKTNNAPSWKGKPTNASVTKKIPTAIRLTPRGRELLDRTP